MYLIRFVLSFAVFMFFMDKANYSQAIEIIIGCILGGIAYYLSGLVENKYIK